MKKQVQTRTPGTQPEPAAPEELLRIDYVRLSQCTLWDKNPKEHDIGGLVESIRRHGFRDAPIVDTTLGAVVAGNGRITALRMLQQQGEQPPRGVTVAKDDGEWCVPIQFGIDAASTAQAEAFAIDHNNLTVMGGDHSIADLLKLYQPAQYLDVLLGLAQHDSMPVSVSKDDLDYLTREVTKRPDFSGLIEQFERDHGEKGPTPKDANWFYVEYYGRQEEYEELLALLAAHMKPGSKHEVDGQFFADAVRNELGDAA